MVDESWQPWCWICDARSLETTHRASCSTPVTVKLMANTPPVWNTPALLTHYSWSKLLFIFSVLGRLLPSGSFFEGLFIISYSFQKTPFTLISLFSQFIQDMYFHPGHLKLSAQWQTQAVGWAGAKKIKRAPAVCVAVYGTGVLSTERAP